MSNYFIWKKVGVPDFCTKKSRSQDNHDADNRGMTVIDIILGFYPSPTSAGDRFFPLSPSLRINFCRWPFYQRNEQISWFSIICVFYCRFFCQSSQTQGNILEGHVYMRSIYLWAFRILLNQPTENSFTRHWFFVFYPTRNRCPSQKPYYNLRGHP